MRTMLCIAVVLLAGCASNSTSRDDYLARRAALFRGAVDSEWQAIDAAIDRDNPPTARYVYAISELRTGAVRAEIMSLIGDGSDRRETREWLDGAEPALTRILAGDAP